MVLQAPAAPPSEARPSADRSSTTPAVQTEIVSAPGPEIIEPSAGTVDGGQPAETVESVLVAEVAASGSWDSARDWAQRRGWSSERIEAWLARLDDKLARHRQGDDFDKNFDGSAGDDARSTSRTPAWTGENSGRDHSESWSGSKREQSRVPPD